MISLQVKTLGSSSTKVARILHYRDPKLIVIPSYDSSSLIIEKITEMQNALNRRKRSEILRREYKHKKALNDTKDIFMDAFSL